MVFDLDSDREKLKEGEDNCGSGKETNHLQHLKPCLVFLVFYTCMSMYMAAQFAIVPLCDYYVQMFMASTGAGIWVYSVNVH